MKELQFTIEIHTSKARVWDTLWQDETLRQWAGIIDPGTHMVGELKVGNEVQFISGNGYGVTSLVEKLRPSEFLLLKHQADTQESGNQEREKEWTGGTESYALCEKDGTTTLTTKFDVPPEQEEYFTANYPKALEQVKLLAERRVHEKTLADLLSPSEIQLLAIPSNFRYGSAIYRRGGVAISEQGSEKVEAWVGGLDGTVAEGGGARRRTRLFVDQTKLKWHCTGNPKNHQIFCKHCVALALAITSGEKQ